MTRGVAALAVVLALVLPGHVAAQDYSRERFELFTECAQIDLTVERLPNDAADIRLTEERIRTIAESRLRAARLYDADALRSLYVRVGITGPAFNIQVAFEKALFDDASVQYGRAKTWERGRYGTHGGDAGYVLQLMSESVDGFVLNYLRVNEDACNTSPGGRAR